MSTCPSCQRELPETSLYCTQCGQRLRINQTKPLVVTHQMMRQEEKPAIQQPYPWGYVVTWVLFAFLLGLAIARGVSGGAERVVAGIFFALCAALTVGIYKFFKRTPERYFSCDSQAADKTLFLFSVGLAMFFAALAIFTQTYSGLLDAGICAFLGVGIRYGTASLRWLLRLVLVGYAFISPILVVTSTSEPGGVLWAFFFLAGCRAILAHQREPDMGSGTTDATTDGARVAALQSTKPHAGASDSIQTTANSNTTQMQEDRLYEQIAQELEANTVDKGLWTKAYARAGGDDTQTRVLYIKSRFAQLHARENARSEETPDKTRKQ
jgi:hypothetical protein